MASSLTRFSDRVDNYIRFRPGYPEAVVDLLCREAGLQPGDAVVDVGSGTGIFAAMFPPRGFVVHAVEPNKEMREAAERLLVGVKGFVSHAAAAENTGLPDGCTRLLTAAQAFHWFDRPTAKKEFERLLQPGGVVALVWNERLVTSTPFLRAYESFLHAHATDYGEVNHVNIADGEIVAFFAPWEVSHDRFPNAQVFDYEGLEGRLLSSSYAPAKGKPGHEAMIADLHRLFDEYQENGKVVFEYDCRVWHARRPG